MRSRLPLLVLVTTLFTAGLLASRLLVTRSVSVHDELSLEAATALHPPRPLPDFELLGDDGQALTRADLTGSWTLVFMGFTHCGDVCPATLYTLTEVAAQLASAPKLLFISVDPERDTPAVIRGYLESFDADWLGANGTATQIDKLADSFGAHWSVSNDPQRYVVEHSSAVFLLDPSTRFAALFSAPLDVDAIAADLAQLTGS